MKINWLSGLGRKNVEKDEEVGKSIRSITLDSMLHAVAPFENVVSPVISLLKSVAELPYKKADERDILY